MKFTEAPLAQAADLSGEALAKTEDPADYGRSTAFRRTILDIYDHQCAACGLRIRLPAGADVSFIDAAHFHASKNLRSQVSALSPPKAPSPDHRWQVSPVVDARRSNGEQALSELTGTTLLLPKDRAFWPDDEALEWRVRNLVA